MGLPRGRRTPVRSRRLRSPFDQLLPEKGAEGHVMTLITLTVGRQSESGRRFLIYKASVLENGVRTTDFDITVMYE